MIFYDIFDCLKEISHCGLKYLFYEILIGCCHPIDLDVIVEFSKFGSGKRRGVSSFFACEHAKVTKRKQQLKSSEENKKII